MAERRQKQTQPRLELLPAELQLTILRSISSLGDLTSLIVASRSYNATYLRHEKLILSHVTQSALGDLFVDACMLYHCKYNITSYTEVEDDEIGSSMLFQWESSLSSRQPTQTETQAVVDTHPWPRGPYRHIQITFLHDYDKLVRADAESQAKYMRGLLTVEDFSRILSFHDQVVRPLSLLCALSISVRRQTTQHHQNRMRQSTICAENDRRFTALETRRMTVGNAPWIMRTLYRFQMYCRLYGTIRTAEDEETFDLEESHRRDHQQAITRDFFSRYDMLEIKEFLVVLLVLTSDIHQYSDTIRERLGNKQPTTSDEVANELMHGDPLHMHNFVWEALTGVRDFYNSSFEFEWPQLCPDEFCKFWE